MTKTSNAKGVFHVLHFSAFEAIEPTDKYRPQFDSLRGYDFNKTHDLDDDQPRDTQRWALNFTLWF